MAAEVPDFAAESNRDVQRAFAEPAPRTVWNVASARAALATRPRSGAAPLPERQSLLVGNHRTSLRGGSDIRLRATVREAPGSPGVCPNQLDSGGHPATGRRWHRRRTSALATGGEAIRAPPNARGIGHLRGKPSSSSVRT